MGNRIGLNNSINSKNLKRSTNTGIYGLKIDDIYALGLLQPLLTGYPFLPFNRASLRPYCVAHMLNDIVLNGRKSIIEFGSGLSTIVIGRLIKKNNLKATLLSVDDNKGWVNRLNDLLTKEGIDDVVRVRCIPLKSCDLALDGNDWYCLDELTDCIKVEKFDMLVIDGPVAWKAEKCRARYPALPFMLNKLENEFAIYLDDAERSGEQAVINKWESEYGFKFTVVNKTLAHYCTGKPFYTKI